jgi:hypothetical protein
MTTETLVTEAPTQNSDGSQDGATQGNATSTEAAATTTNTAATTETTQATDAPKPDEGAKAKGAPETYEFQAPEGHAFDAKVIEQFSEVAKELNLPQEAAQKVLDKVAPTIAARQAELIEQTRMQWETESKADKEFGGDKLDESLAVAKKALDTFGTKEFKTLLNESGLGSHPEMIRMLMKAGKAISEDKFIGGKATDKPHDAKMMYPNSKMN